MREVLERAKINRSSRALQAVRAPEHVVDDPAPTRTRPEASLSARRLADPLDVLLVLDLERRKEQPADVFHVRYFATFLLSCCPSPVRFVAAFSSWLVLTAVWSAP